MVECNSGGTAGHSEDWPALLMALGNLSEWCYIWKCDEKQCLRFHMRWCVPPPSDNLWTFFCTAIADVDQNLMDRLQRVNNTLFSQISRLQNIRNTIGETGNLAEQARSRVESTEQLIEIASRELEKAKVAIANVVSDWDSLRWDWGSPLVIHSKSFTGSGVLSQINWLFVSFYLSLNMEEESHIAHSCLEIVIPNWIKTKGHLGPVSSFGPSRQFKLSLFSAENKNNNL